MKTQYVKPIAKKISFKYERVLAASCSSDKVHVRESEEAFVCPTFYPQTQVGGFSKSGCAEIGDSNWES